ncbi:MAG: hypothetical protein WC545_02200 [Patescibacteria group bacterium]
MSKKNSSKQKQEIKFVIGFPRRPELDEVLEKLRKSGSGTEAYRVLGQDAFNFILAEILPKLNKLKDTIELYYLRLRCNGHPDIITACEQKLVVIIRKNSTLLSGQSAYLKKFPWYNYISAGFTIFSEEIMRELKRNLNFEKVSANQLLAV